MTKHTPGPWILEEAEPVPSIHAQDGTLVAVLGYDDREPCENAKIDARFIVQACNAHDDLLAAGKAVFQGACPDPERPAMSSRGLVGTFWITEDRVSQLGAAIAAAERMKP